MRAVGAKGNGAGCRTSAGAFGHRSAVLPVPVQLLNCSERSGPAPAAAAAADHMLGCAGAVSFSVVCTI